MAASLWLHFNFLLVPYQNSYYKYPFCLNYKSPLTRLINKNFSLAWAAQIKTAEINLEQGFYMDYYRYLRLYPPNLNIDKE